MQDLHVCEREGMLVYLEVQKNIWIDWIWCGQLF